MKKFSKIILAIAIAIISIPNVQADHLIVVSANDTHSQIEPSGDLGSLLGVVGSSLGGLKGSLGGVLGFYVLCIGESHGSEQSQCDKDFFHKKI